MLPVLLQSGRKRKGAKAQESNAKKARGTGKEANTTAAATAATTAAASTPAPASPSPAAKQAMKAADLDASKHPEFVLPRDAPKGTLVVCPLSVMSNWVTQLEDHTRGGLSLHVYHGSTATGSAKGGARRQGCCLSAAPACAAFQWSIEFAF